MLIILYIVAAVLIFRFFYKEIGEFDIDATILSLAGCTFLALAFAAFVPIPLFWGEPEVLKESKEIVSIKSSSTTQGNFFLGCGNIGGEERYVFFRKQGDCFVKDWESARTPICQNNETPHVEYQYSRWISNNWLCPHFKFVWQDTYLTPTKIVVPKNTIIENFKLE